MCWLSRTLALGVFRTKSSPNCVPSEGKYRSDRKAKECKWQEVRRGRESKRGRGEGEGEGGQERYISARFTLWTSANVIPIAIEAPLWSYERVRSHTVLLSSLSLVLCLNYLWKTSIEGMWWLKGFHTNNAKSKKALEWTKKCHISLRSWQKKKTWSLATKGR